MNVVGSSEVVMVIPTLPEAATKINGGGKSKKSKKKNRTPLNVVAGGTVNTDQLDDVSVDLQDRLKLSEDSGFGETNGHEESQHLASTALHAEARNNTSTSTTSSPIIRPRVSETPSPPDKLRGNAAIDQMKPVDTADGTIMSTQQQPLLPNNSVVDESTTTAKTTGPSAGNTKLNEFSIAYVSYQNELQMPDIMRLIQKDLSEPYSIYTYRYFIHNWPKLCFLAMHGEQCVGAIVCKLDIHRQTIKRGYIAMLAVDKEYRKLKIGTNLVRNAIQAMLAYNADEVVLETEITNLPALRLYENLGFVRDKRLFGYYLNGVDALRLKLWFR